MAKLTERMESWLRHLGAHVAVTKKGAFPTTIVANACECECEGECEEICFCLSQAQRDQIADIIAENDWVAIAPGGLGAVRAPYQFKGHGRLQDDKLIVNVEQVYCTKPGCEAGRRLDVLEWGDMCEFDFSRWQDINPPGVE